MGVKILQSPNFIAHLYCVINIIFKIKIKRDTMPHSEAAFLSLGHIDPYL